MITDHKTIFAYSAERLDALIASAIADGWQPLGGITAASEPGRGMVLYRAMVKYEAIVSIPSMWSTEYQPIDTTVTSASTVVDTQADGKRKKAGK